MTIAIERLGGRIRMTPAAADIYAGCALRDALLAALDSDASEVEVDLSSVTEIDSAGLQVLIAAKKLAGARNKSLRLTRHGPASVAAIDRNALAAFFGERQSHPAAQRPAETMSRPWPVGQSGEVAAQSALAA